MQVASVLLDLLVLTEEFETTFNAIGSIMASLSPAHILKSHQEGLILWNVVRLTLEKVHGRWPLFLKRY